jgi:AcrR family transcriptional regulator
MAGYVSPGMTTPTSAPSEQRARILDTALALMSERGSADTSMRRLADACRLNVATLYHYFPSKSDLLRSVIEERGYFGLLADEGLPDPLTMDAELPVAERLVAFLAFVSAAARAEEAPIRLLLGEGLRQEPTAQSTASDLLAAIDDAMGRWLAEAFADLPGDPAVQGRVVRHLVVSRLVDVLATPVAAVADDETWAREVAPVLLP